MYIVYLDNLSIILKTLSTSYTKLARPTTGLKCNTLAFFQDHYFLMVTPQNSIHLQLMANPPVSFQLVVNTCIKSIEWRLRYECQGDDKS